MFVVMKALHLVGIINGVYDDSLMFSRIRIQSFFAPVVIASAGFTVPSN
jgi:hypothetical protein